MAAIGIILFLIGMALREYAGKTWDFSERAKVGNAAVCLLIPGGLLMLVSAAIWLWRHAP